MPGGIPNQGVNILGVGCFACSKDDVTFILRGSICGWGGGRAIIIIFCFNNEEAKSGVDAVVERLFLLSPAPTVLAEDDDGAHFSLRPLLRKAWETFSRATYILITK